MTRPPQKAGVYFPGLYGFFAAMAVACSHVELMKEYHGFPSAYQKPAVCEISTASYLDFEKRFLKSKLAIVASGEDAEIRVPGRTRFERGLSRPVTAEPPIQHDTWPITSSLKYRLSSESLFAFTEMPSPQ